MVFEQAAAASDATQTKFADDTDKPALISSLSREDFSATSSGATEQRNFTVASNDTSNSISFASQDIYRTAGQAAATGAEAGGKAGAKPGDASSTGKVGDAQAVKDAGQTSNIRMTDMPLQEWARKTALESIAKATSPQALQELLAKVPAEAKPKGVSDQEYAQSMAKDSQMVMQAITSRLAEALLGHDVASKSNDPFCGCVIKWSKNLSEISKELSSGGATSEQVLAALNMSAMHLTEGFNKFGLTAGVNDAKQFVLGYQSADGKYKAQIAFDPLTGKAVEAIEESAEAESAEVKAPGQDMKAASASMRQRKLGPDQAASLYGPMIDRVRDRAYEQVPNEIKAKLQIKSARTKS